jgi:NAD(P)-dependent dehydrogenase (short-subunit alcohol dehydrogenase family)
VSDWTENRVAVVTGGASGIGLAISQRLARDGAAVAIFDLDGGAAEAAASGITHGGDRALGFKVDVTDRARIEQAVGEVSEQLGAPLVLVNNAGQASFMPFLDMSPEHFHQIIEVNLVGTFHCCQAVLPHMLEAGWGRIVNISSSSTYSGTPRMAAYVSSKSAINGLTLTLAREFGPRGVTVNAIPPSFIDTPMLRASAAAGDLDVQASIATTPVRRQGRPEDIAAACSFLCRDEASYITGQILGVTGGRS